MLKESALQIISDSLVDLKHPVRLVIFTSDTGCDSCPQTLELARAVKTASSKIAFEHYDFIMDRDKREEYGVKRVPSLIVQGPGRKTVAFSGAVEGISLIMLLDAIIGIANNRIWFPDKIISMLKLIERDVAIKVFLDNDCSLCKPVADTAVALALTNNRIKTEIIVADDFPELLSKYRVKILPYTLFGSKHYHEGHLEEGAFLEMIFQAEGKGDEPDKRCVVCGTKSPDIICSSCKTKIQAEAADHKRRDERLQERGTVVEPKHHN